jgi:glutathione S-transferase
MNPGESAMQLVIGTRQWSSWSLRPWLALKRAGAAFEEIMVPLRTPETTALLAPYSPGGQCPVLIDGELTVWDSLAICEYLAERYPGLWPQDAAARALGRSACAQMHSGFPSLRGECSMDLAAPVAAVELSPATQSDIRKIVALWRGLRERLGERGPFLLGDWSIADAFYTPVATRFRTYGVNLADYGDDDGEASAYNALLLAQPEFLEWERLAVST